MRRADNLTTFMCRLSRNLGASNSWNPIGLQYAGIITSLLTPFSAVFRNKWRYTSTLVFLHGVHSDKKKFRFSPVDNKIFEAFDILGRSAA